MSLQYWEIILPEHQFPRIAVYLWDGRQFTGVEIEVAEGFQACQLQGKLWLC